MLGILFKLDHSWLRLFAPREDKPFLWCEMVKLIENTRQFGAGYRIKSLGLMVLIWIQVGENKVMHERRDDEARKGSGIGEQSLCMYSQSMVLLRCLHLRPILFARSKYCSPLLWMQERI
ncbi:hypothetical protein PanWU01x14_013620 [Parasponia andersonii]|uniref:Uncharacterized protein n=1 Tax=Parasponia andersonii TaxID=3476 RepID=A0A2P5E139_PARAD|nr:hypothetical protein PanWU01x14_013620 [Parasponia andersonii]